VDWIGSTQLALQIFTKDGGFLSPSRVPRFVVHTSHVVSFNFVVFFVFASSSLSCSSYFSGLAVEPNNDDENASDSIFNLAESAGPDDVSGDAPVRRTITMYRDGFVVDDGPYRRLDDPANAGFLRSLARGQTPQELVGDGPGGNTTVGLIDKRGEDYVETFRSFSGAGQSLGGGGAAPAEGGDIANGIFDPSSLPAPSPDDASAPTTSIAVRMLDGSRKVVKIALSATVAELASRASAASNSTISTPFRIVAGFPPKPLSDGNQTVEEAGLKGARVQLQKA
jgi:UBX domain-containing protein 1